MRLSEHKRTFPFLGALALALIGMACGGPLGPIAGGHLRGNAHTGAVKDWSFAKDVHTVQLETNPKSPHSVNTWIGVVDGHAYIPTSLILGSDVPTERKWVANVVANPAIRLRIEGVVFDLDVVKVENAEEREKARSAMMTKYGADPDPHSTDAWIFRLEER
jgi:hypothetical protein